MTEDEAKTKHCPLAKDFNGHVWTTVDNGDHSLTYSPFCIASACMAWRWGLTPKRAAQLESERTGMFQKTPIVADGHCGLAGSPQ